MYRPGLEMTACPVPTLIPGPHPPSREAGKGSLAMRPEEEKLCHQPATSVTLPSVKKAQETEDVKSEKTWEDIRCIFKQRKDLLVKEGRLCSCHAKGSRQNLWMHRRPGEAGGVNRPSRFAQAICL